MTPLMKLAAVALAAALVAGAPVPTTAAPTARQATVSAYPQPSIYPASTAYAVTVNGVPVPVVGYASYDYAHYSQGRGKAVIRVTALGQTAINAYRVSPQKLTLPATTSGNVLTVTLNRDEYLIIKIDAKKELVLAADPAETDRPKASGKGVFNVRSAPYDADPTGATMTTAALQKAIDDAAAHRGGRGVVYVPAGLYLVGNLILRSDVALYLEGGAVLRFSGRKADYTIHWHKDSQNRDITWWISTAPGSKDIKVYGRGTLDGNGYNATRTGDIGNNILVPMQTEDFDYDGLVVRDSGSWAVTPVRSEDLSFKNLKVFNRFDMGENDGVDIIESQDVKVEHAIGVALDDPFSTKTWRADTDIARSWPGAPEKQQDVVFDDLVSWTFCYGFKVGAGILQDQEDITFSNGVVYDAAVGLGIAHSYGDAAAKGVTFRNIDIERLSFVNAGNRTWLNFFVEERGTGTGPVSDVTVENIEVRDRGRTYGKLKGASATAGLGGLTFKNVVMPGAAAPATNLAELNLLDRAHVDGVTILPRQTPEPPVRVNLALGKPATASTSEGPAALAVDGDFGTRWGSARTDSQWFAVDLGTPRTIDGVRIHWEVAYGKSFRIQLSDDGVNWSDVYATTTGDGELDEINFPAATARHVRMSGSLRGTVYGYSIWEFEVVGPA